MLSKPLSSSLAPSSKLAFELTPVEVRLTTRIVTPRVSAIFDELPIDDQSFSSKICEDNGVNPGCITASKFACFVTHLDGLHLRLIRYSRCVRLQCERGIHSQQKQCCCKVGHRLQQCFNRVSSKPMEAEVWICGGVGGERGGRLWPHPRTL